MGDIGLNFGGRTRFYKIIEDPVKHIIVDSKKEMHGWSESIEIGRECTAERLLINPYIGCDFRCFFCYAYGMYGQYFDLYRKKNIITVFNNYDKVVNDQLNKIPFASCGYVTAIADAFQEINNKYKLTEKIIDVFNSYNLPIDVLTKGVISDEAILGLSKNPYSFAQVTILTQDDSLRKKLTRGASVDKSFDNIKRLKDKGVYTVARIDPIIPFVNDSNLEGLVDRLAHSGVNHVIASIMDITNSMSTNIYNGVKSIVPDKFQDFRNLYSEKIKNKQQANIEYRKRIFGKLRKSCDKQNITFALCMEFQDVDGKIVGLNKEFMSSINCEGMDTPMHIKVGSKFKPIANCNGNCISCNSKSELPACGQKKLKEAGSLKISDYKKLSIQREFDLS